MFALIELSTDWDEEETGIETSEQRYRPYLIYREDHKREIPLYKLQVDLPQLIFLRIHIRVP